jgi:TetR/AcrR family transcriptional regulator, ethionamide resistance regulator
MKAKAGPASPGSKRRKRRDELILDALERLLAKVPMRELDVESIAAEAGITRSRFYAYYTSKNDALAALLRRMLDIRRTAFEHTDSWFIGRPPDVRPRDSISRTVKIVTDSWWPHRSVLREACDLWSVVPEVRDTWLEVIDEATARGAEAIQRERDLGVAPPGYDARLVSESLAWQSERLNFRAWADIPGAMTREQLHEVRVECYMRTVFLADDPDPEGGR